VRNVTAWSLKPLADDTEDEADAAIFLNPAQRAALIAAADEHTGAFLRGLELTGARPKELAAACVRDFDGKALKFSHRKGRPVKVRVRHTVLGPEGVEFFTQRAADKLPTAPLFTEDGKHTCPAHGGASDRHESRDDRKGLHAIYPGGAARKARRAQGEGMKAHVMPHADANGRSPEVHHVGRGSSGTNSHHGVQLLGDQSPHHLGPQGQPR
jgi:integrase